MRRLRRRRYEEGGQPETKREISMTNTKNTRYAGFDEETNKWEVFLDGEEISKDDQDGLTELSKESGYDRVERLDSQTAVEKGKLINTETGEEIV